MSEITVGKPLPGELELINGFAPKSLTEDEVFVFSLTLCDNDIDRDYERFSDEALYSLSTHFVGKTGIFDHAHKAGNQLARVISCHVEKTGERTLDGRDYLRLRARAYMLRNDRTRELISEIEGGIKKEVSVGCAIKSRVCSVCGADRSAGCTHRPGKKYGGAVCHTVLSDASDAYEWSFVAVPAQRKAGVTKSFSKRNDFMEKKDIFKTLSSGEKVTLTPEDASVILAEFSALKTAASIGEQYLSERRSAVIKGLLNAMPSLKESAAVSICEKLSLSELDEIYRGFAAAPAEPQLGKHSKNREDIGGFMIK